MKYKTLTVTGSLLAAVLILATLAPQATAQSELRIDFKPGWNMFSSPVRTLAYEADDMTIVENTCGDLDSWHYSASIMKTYVRNTAAKLSIGRAHSILATQRPASWINVERDCHITLRGSPFNLHEYPGMRYPERFLYGGWNQVGSPYTDTMRFVDIPTDCTILSGPWEWNAVTQQYTEATVLEPLAGYWIKVENTCLFPLVEEQPIGPPE